MRHFIELIVVVAVLIFGLGMYGVTMQQKQDISDLQAHVRSLETSESQVWDQVEVIREDLKHGHDE